MFDHKFSFTFLTDFFNSLLVQGYKLGHFLFIHELTFNEIDLSKD
jgi:hypothetical protein